MSQTTCPDITGFECCSVLSTSCELRWYALRGERGKGIRYEIAWRPEGQDGDWNLTLVENDVAHFCLEGLKAAVQYRIRMRSCRIGDGSVGDFTAPPIRVRIKS